MNELLVFRLFGPLASWGEVAVGGVRPSAIRPTRSAILGLVAAALGLRRGDDDEQEQLSAGLGLAVRGDAPGTAIIDYQTVNWRRPKREIVLTRADELRASREDLSTVQSSRHYRCDAVATVGIWTRDQAPWSLLDLRTALEYPVFPLYLGRKACPPAWPLGPEIVPASTLADAFRTYDELRPLPPTFHRRIGFPPVVEIAWDTDLELPAGLDSDHVQIVQRRDEPLSRRRWRFSTRQEAVSRFDRRKLAAREEDSDASESPLAR